LEDCVKTYTITITTNYPDAEAAVREAAEKIACVIGWGDDSTTSIEAVGPECAYLAGYNMEPGETSEQVQAHDASNPNYWKETIQYVQTVCKPPESGSTP
jgi:hypothetical protein